LLMKTAASSKAFIGHDSGPTHLAAALGVSTSVVFLATQPSVWRPLGPASVLEPKGLPGKPEDVLYNFISHI